MHKRIIKSSRSYVVVGDGRHRFEHWYVDQQVYFITARCREKFPAFESIEAREIFWDRFTHYAKQYGYEPWVTSLLNNHYHTLGFLHLGKNLQPFMQHLHGSVAKLVNDRLPERREAFWRDPKGHEYFDGCIRNEKQCRAAYRYTLLQGVRGGFVSDWREFEDTVMVNELEECVTIAKDRQGFLEDTPYKRYRK